MDLTRAVAYRGFNLNDVDLSAPAGPIAGCSVEAAKYSEVRAVGYLEKRARDDGMDSGDVYLSARPFMLRGHIYGTSRGNLFDRVDALVAALAPTLAYDEDPEEWGFMPLTFYKATDLTEDFEDGYVQLFARVRPKATPEIEWVRNRSGGIDDEGFGVPWSVMLDAKDPRLYINELVEATIGSSGTLSTRGTYNSPLDISITAPSNSLSTMRLLIGGADITFSVDTTGTAQALAWDGRAKTLTRTVSGVPALRQDLVSNDGEEAGPHVPAGGGAYTRTTTGTAPGSATLTASYYEAYI